VAAQIDGLKSQGEACRHPIILTPILRHSSVATTPLGRAEAKAAELTLERIDREDSQQSFRRSDRGNPPDKLPGTVRTFHLRHLTTRVVSLI
jgi:hypothetical protein